MIWSIVDGVISICVEYTKTLIRELFLLYFQLLGYIAMFILHFWYKPGNL